MTFRTTLQLSKKTATGIHVPEAIVEALGGGKRPAVLVTINGHSYRSSIAVMGGVYMLPVSAEQRQAAGVAAGDEIEVQLELDTAPREVSIPDDFATALAGDAEAGAAFAKLSYSGKRQHVLAIEGAKTEETRQRRIAGALTKLRGG